MPTKKDIHREVLRRAEGAVKDLAYVWREGEEPFAMAWPAESLKGDDGATITDAVLCVLSGDKKEQIDDIRKLVTRTRAFALLWVRATHDRLIAMFSGPAGGKLWVYSIEEGKTAGAPMERQWD